MLRRKVAVVDENQTYRIGIKTVIDSAPDLRVAAEAATHAEALYSLPRWSADIVLFEWETISRTVGLFIESVRTHLPQAKLVVHSDSFTQRAFIEALQRGIQGYISKSVTGERLIEGLHAVLNEEVYYLVRKKAGVDLPGNSGSIVGDGSDGNLLATLTAREREVFLLVVEGRTTREIAAALCISGRTVENHRSHLMRKLDLRNQIDLIRFAARNNMMEV